MSASLPGVTIDTTADQQRREQLRRMKRVPLLFLVGAGVLFVIGWWQAAQVDAAWWWGYVQAAGEAGLVGGLADWFAVTALFRHPLRIPIPHTAIIPRKKDQLGESLGTFVRTQFLNADTVQQRLTQVDPAAAVARYLNDPGHRSWLTQEAAKAGQVALRSVDDAGAQLLIRNVVFGQVANYAWSPPLGKVLQAVVEDQGHAPAVEVLLGAARDWVRSHEAELINLVADRGPAQGFFLARAAHEAVGRRAYQELLRWLNEALTDRNCPTRLALDRWLLDTSARLREDPAMIAKVEDFKQQLLSSPEAQEAVAAMWPSLKQLLLDNLTDSDSELHRRFNEALAQFARRIETEPSFKANLNAKISAAVGYLVNQYGDEFSTIISDTVGKWDSKEAADRIELHVGKDLQYIRINGTVVGALAGVAIHAIGMMLIG